MIYDSRNSSLPMAVFSPLNFPKAHHMASTDALYGAGVKATVEVIPAGWSQLFLLSAGHGINNGMMNWGDRMLRWTGKPRADMYLDQTHSTIGFWTDNGGYSLPASLQSAHSISKIFHQKYFTITLPDDGAGIIITQPVTKSTVRITARCFRK